MAVDPALVDRGGRGIGNSEAIGPRLVKPDSLPGGGGTSHVQVCRRHVLATGGLTGAAPGVIILIKAPGSSTETMTINKPMTIRSVGGTTTIGK